MFSIGIFFLPLASPDILGINHAASLASVGALLLMPSLSVMVLPLLAFAGGMAGYQSTLWYSSGGRAPAG
ncbi:iron chelate uptake ABC transporter family permease subunit, partial [Klebsiella pneumoniae]